jgi:hypothetical protein
VFFCVDPALFVFLYIWFIFVSITSLPQAKVWYMLILIRSELDNSDSEDGDNYGGARP